MTEREWLDCTEPMKMVEFALGKVSDRKLRLAGVAFCRRIWRLLPDEPCREAVRVAERYADGLANDRERLEARKRVATRRSRERGDEDGARRVVFYLSEKTAGKYPIFVTGKYLVAFAASARYRSRKKSFPLFRAALNVAARAEARLMRCVCGNPFRPVGMNPKWLARGGESLRKFAQSLYDRRRMPAGTFDPLRVRELGCALEDVGCSDDSILRHLAGPGPHIRGCWAVDLVLGKE